MMNNINNNIVASKILKGNFKEDLLLPNYFDRSAFRLQSLQFSVRLAIVMIIKKAQGKLLQVCGLNLNNPCFLYREICLPCSRVGKPSNLFVYAPEGNTKYCVS